MRSLFASEPDRAKIMATTYQNKLYFDFSRQLLSHSHFKKRLTDVSDAVSPKIKDMFSGEIVNFTEKRPVMHMALRAHQTDVYAKEEVYPVLTQIQEFSSKVHSGDIVSSTGKKFKNILSIGIGGSYLGVEFVYQAIQNDKLMNLRMLANIDPCDFHDCVRGIDAEDTLVIVISKTFTTQETMINANTVKEWLCSNIEKPVDEIVKRHMVAVSTNIEKVSKYGIENVFGFWDWVGGRFSTWSAVGILPLSLAFGYPVMEEFLDGGRDADLHFLHTEPDGNIPMILGALSIDNIESGRNVRAILPYSQALNRFPAHIQQLEMESNGKSIDKDGCRVEKTGEIILGEPGTNAQHSFYQLLHQGTSIIPCEFIGFCKQRYNHQVADNTITNHDELMCNVFAQMDALAFGKNRDELLKESCPDELIPHKTFDGNRPSSLLLFEELTPWAIGFLMALYEHRTAVIGFYLHINSFDQWGVELGKQLAKQIKSKMEGENIILNDSTENMMEFYLKERV
jgi:glucose-6-phosphate isomerase